LWVSVDTQPILYMYIFTVCHEDAMFRPLYFRPSSGPSITLLLAMPGVMWRFA